MSIASRITSIENHIENAYDSLSYMGETATNKNIENITGLVDNIYSKLPKVTNSTASSSVTLNPTLKGRIDSTEYGQIGQNTTTGKNKFGFNNWYQDNNATHSIINVNKLEVTATRTNAYANSKFKVNLEDGTYTFSLGKVTNSNSEMTTKRMTLAYYINNTRTAVQHIDEGTPQTITITNETGKEYILEFWGNYSTNIANTAIYEEVQIEPGSAKTNWEEYTGGIASPNPNYEQKVKCVTGENTVRVRGKNLLDKQYYENGSIDGTTGEDIANNRNGRCSNYIPVLPNTIYTFSSITSVFNLRLNEYTSNKTNIQRDSVTSTSSLTITTTANTFFVRWSLNYDNSTLVTQEIIDSLKLMLETGSTAHDYEPYYTPQEKPLNLGNLEVYENGYFSRENGKWYLNNEYDKFIINSNFIQGNSTNRFVLQSANLNKYSSSSIGLCTIGNIVGSSIEPTEAGLINFYIQPSINYLNAYVKYNSMTLTEFNTKIQELISATKTPYLVCKLQTPLKIEITDATLFNQLEEIYKLMSYTGTTIIETECEVGNMPIIINAKALLDSEKKIDDLETRIEILESEE